MKSFSSDLRFSDITFLVIAVLLVVFYVASSAAGFPLDDSWIHQVYGRNLALTGEWAFVPGVASAASTSPLYTVLLSVGYRLGLPYLVWTHGLGILALALSAMIAARMARRLLVSQPAVEWIAGLGMLFAWHLIWASASGMETMLFCLWTLVLPYLAWYQSDRLASSNRMVFALGLLFGACAALATLTRPEGILLAGLVGLAMLVAHPSALRSRMLLWGIGSLIAFAIVVTPYFILNIRLTGGILPDTAAAKQAENAPLLAVSYPGRLLNMLFPLIAGPQLFLLPGLAFVAVDLLRRLQRDRRTVLLLLPLLWSLALVALYAARLPAPYQHGRYVIPVLPSAILLGLVGTGQLLTKGRHSAAGRVLTRALAASLGLAYIYFALAAGPGIFRQDVAIINEEMVAAARWIEQHIPEDELLAVHDIGAVGYFAPRPILDLAGLISPEIVSFINEKEPLWQWLQQRGARYLMAFPDQVPGDDSDDARLCPIFTTLGSTSPAAGGPNMTVYALAWDGRCPSDS